MSTGFPESVDMRSTDVLDRWTAQLRHLFADHYGPDAGLVLVQGPEDWRLAADSVSVLDAVEATTPLTDLWTSLVTTQRDRYGDGATFAALFALALTIRSTEQADRGLHPTTIQRGYEMAFQAARSHLADAAVVRDDPQTMQDLLHGVAAGEGLASHAAVPTVANTVAHDTSRFSPQVLTRNAGDETDSEAHPGVVITKAPESDEPFPLSDARILLVDERLYYEDETEDDHRSRTVSQLSVSDPADAGIAETTLQNRYEEWADAIVEVDPDVVVTLKGVAAEIKRRLRAANITLVHRSKPTDVLERLSASTGATVVSRVADVDRPQLGTAEKVALREFNDLEYVTVRGRLEGPWTLFVRNWTWSAVELAGDATDILLTVGKRAADERTYLPGAGASEIDAAQAVRDRARTIGDREALAIRAYADALEDTVSILASNLGRDSMQSLARLRNGPPGTGLVGDRTEVGDALGAGAVDLASAKRAAVAAATNTALTLLRVDALVTTTG